MPIGQRGLYFKMEDSQIHVFNQYNNFKGTTSSNFKQYTKNNCKYECHINLAKEFCKCLPWDYIDNKGDGQGFKECDVFGRTCFWRAMERYSISEYDRCPECKPECDYVKFEKVIKSKEMLVTLGISGGKYYNRQLSKCPIQTSNTIRIFSFLLQNTLEMMSE